MAVTYLYSGNPLMVDYTPGAAVDAGDVVLQGEVIGYALKDIAASAKGALAVSNAVMKVTKATGAWTAGQKIYYDESEENFTTTATGNYAAGYAAAAAISGATRCSR